MAVQNILRSFDFPPLLIRVVALVAAGAVLVSGAQAAPAHAAEPDFVPSVAGSVVPGESPVEAFDAEAVAEAAEEFTPGDPIEVAELAEAASTTEAVEIAKTLHGMVAETRTGVVEVSRDGVATLSVEGLPEIGISVGGDAESFMIVEGAVVQTEVAPSTDVVTRATDEGVQMIAILGDENAPNEIEFPLELPEGVDLVERPDGSIAVSSDVEAEVPAEGEEERIAAAIDVVLVDDELDELSDEQIRLLAKIPDAKTVTAAVTTQVALIEAPWAVDANGRALKTRYELEGDTLVQVIETDESTAFPVVADPGIVAGALKLGACIVSVGSIFILPAAGIAKLAAKFLVGLKKA
ncbi:MAG: hypothetical protein QM628_18190 [Propionicimonas sp.]